MTNLTSSQATSQSVEAPTSQVTLEPQTDRLSWGVVELQVTDLDKAVGFWTMAIGLGLIEQTDASALLGNGDKTLFVLHAGANRGVEPGYTGMYHVAIGVRSQAEFSRLLARLIHLNVQVGPTDHLMAKSLYLVDPDGLEIEITLETPERFGHFGDMSKGLTIFDIEGRPHSGRGPLDVNAELEFAKDADLMTPIAKDSYLAHLHFKVANIEPALDWFETLGFSRHLTLSNWGFADMGAGLENTHRLAMNIWSGEGNTPAPEGMARLLKYELNAQDADVFENAKTNNTNLTIEGEVLKGIDPAGVEVALLPFKD
ncbi:MAG: VOC family protein [Nitratireductor sp.]